MSGNYGISASLILILVHSTQGTLASHSDCPSTNGCADADAAAMLQTKVEPDGLHWWSPSPQRRNSIWSGWADDVKLIEDKAGGSVASSSLTAATATNKSDDKGDGKGDDKGDKKSDDKKSDDKKGNSSAPSPPPAPPAESSLMNSTGGAGGASGDKGGSKDAKDGKSGKDEKSSKDDKSSKDGKSDKDDKDEKSGKDEKSDKSGDDDGTNPLAPSPSKPCEEDSPAPAPPYWPAHNISDNSSVSGSSNSSGMLQPLAQMSASEEAALKKKREEALLNCIVEEWSEWTPCEQDSNDMYLSPKQTRQRVIINQPQEGGKACPSPLFEAQMCATEPA